MKKILLLVITVLLIGCIRDGDSISIVLEEAQIEQLSGPRIPYSIENQVRFQVAGIYALSSDCAFLYGEFRVSGGRVRSVVLKTSDGGKSWQEVMYPVRGSDVRHIDFTEQVGRAIVLNSVESPGNFLIYQSMDTGNSWKRIAEIDNLNFGVPKEMMFLDEKTGQIIVKVSIPSQKYVYFHTNDGGETWEEGEILDEYTNNTNPKRSLAYDKSEWEYRIIGEAAQDRQIQIIRRIYDDEFKINLPILYDFLNDQVMSP